ncbi:hypothetical protein BFW01_g11695 [Lasiodiplodia theobromae]|nr:hypothetical protein BFW01_g11695 [Lasiodiplodia theobromae]
MTVTIPHMSWYGWYLSDPLTTLDTSRSGLSPPDVKFSSSLRELIIEFETLERMKHQLDEIIEARAMSWRFYREDGMSLSPAPSLLKYYKWTGAADFGGRDWPLTRSTEETDDYYVVALTYTQSC